MIASWGPMLFGIAMVGGYLLGSIPFGVIVTRLGGAGDVRRIGSGSGFVFGDDFQLRQRSESGRAAGGAAVEQHVVVAVSGAVAKVLRRPLTHVDGVGQAGDLVAVYQQPGASGAPTGALQLQAAQILKRSTS